MNLIQVLESALPDLPPQRRPDWVPRIHPRIIAREHLEREGPIVRALVPDGPPHFFRFTHAQYQLAQLFDGERSYQEIATLFRRQTGASVSAHEVNEFADGLEKVEFWYKTPAEESIILCHQLAEHRRKKITKKHANVDLTTIELYYFDPHKYLNWVHEKLKFMYTPWFTAWSLFMVGVMWLILGSHWKELWNDSVYFYNLTAQGVWHVIEFFGIFLILAFFHETAHGVTCKHYGGESYRMGFFTMYLAPGCFCDVATAFVCAGRWGRIATVASGVWAEVMLCSYLSVVWWLTPPGSTVHDIAYMIILSGGIFAVLINYNPLSRMDGYFILCEICSFFDLKGNSTAYLVSLVRKHVFRMPANVPNLPPMRRIGFVTYAFLSGVYCYSLLLFFVRVSYRVVYFYSPVWAFLPATVLAVLIFRSRIKKFVTFLKELYLDKRELMRVHRKRLIAAATVGLILALIPIRREVVEQRFVLEPIRRAVIRAEVSGRVEQVLTEEGQYVQAGATIARLGDLSLESQAAEASAQYRAATARATDALLRHTDYASAELQRRSSAEADKNLREKLRHLEIKTDIAGVVVTPRMRDLRESYVLPGTQIAEIVDPSVMRARLYVPESEFYKLGKVDGAVLRMDSLWQPRPGIVVSVSPTSRQVEPGLVPPSPDYQGMHLPAYFTVDVVVANTNQEFRDGMTGTGKILGRRRSLLGLLLQPVADAVSRRLW